MKQNIILVLCCFLFLTGCAGGAIASANQTTTPSINQRTATILPVSSVTVVASSGGPGDSNTPTVPAAQPTQPTPSTFTGNHQCNSGSCSNPWGYVIGLSGNEQGNYIYSPPASFCGWFVCIPNFAYGRGSVVECSDGMFSKSGGISGACSGHRGEWEALYQLISDRDTPTVQPTKTPTPLPRPSPTPTPTSPLPLPPESSPTP